MDVVPDWDVEMGAMWGRANNEYGVLTTYVHVKESITTLQEAKDKNKLVPHLCQVQFTVGKNPRYVQVSASDTVTNTQNHPLLLGMLVHRQ